MGSPAPAHAVSRASPLIKIIKRHIADTSI